MFGVARIGVFVLIIAFFGFKTSHTQGIVPKGNATYNVIAVQGGGYGYDVFADGKRMIHQTTIPGRPGNSGFKKKSDAEKVAKLVIRKLKNNEIPPTITEEELRKLKVIE